MILSNFAKFFFGVVWFSLTVPTFLFAQSGEVEGLALAEINVGNTVMGVTKDEINIAFSISNLGSIPQSDIRYGTELIKTNLDGGQVMVDRLVAVESLSLASKSSELRNFTHPLYGVAPGEYSVWVVAMTTGGVTLGLANAGTVNVTESNAVSFLVDTCALTVGEEITKYRLDHGVDIMADEDLRFSCQVKNYGNSDKVISPLFNTYRRTAFGDFQELEYPQVDAVIVKAGEEKEVSFLIKKASVPQAYDVVLALTDETGQVVSGHISLHYVLRGASATIQTVNFDKTKYEIGDQLSMSFYWTGSADGFADSRGGVESSLNGSVNAKLSVVDSNGVTCIDEVRKTVMPGEVKLQAVARVECVDPVATLSLVDESGSILDVRTVEVDSPVEVATETGLEKPTPKKNNPYSLLVLVLAAVAAIGLLVVMMRRNKLGVTDTAKLLVFTVMVTGGLLAGAPQAEAVNWTHRWSNAAGTYDMGVVVNINDADLVFAPGQTIPLTSRVTNLTCANNVVAIHRLTATLQSQSVTLSDINVNSPTPVNGSGSLVAPTTPGPYTVRATILTKARGETSYRDITINVVAPTVAAVGNFDTTDAGTCSVSGWAYDADAPASSINVHVYRDGRAGAGGTFVGACATNQLRADVNAAYGISGNHGFNCALPASYIGTGNHALYIHAIDINGVPNNVISNSPQNLNCIPAPAATISATCPAPIPVGGSTCAGTVTWNITNASAYKVYNNTAWSVYSFNASGVDQPIDLPFGDTTLTAQDGGNVLSSVTVSVACAPGSSWDGSICASTTVPTASISVDTTPCYIAAGTATCNTNVTWDIDNATNPNVYHTFTSSSISANDSGTEPVVLDRGSHTFAARDNATTLASVNVIVDCEAGSSWDGSVCVVSTPTPPSPSIDLDLSRELIRSGATVDVTVGVTAEYTAECTLYGVHSTPIVFTHSGTPVNPVLSQMFTSRPLTAAQEVSISCVPNPANGAAPGTANSRVNVIPAIEEV